MRIFLALFCLLLPLPAAAQLEVCNTTAVPHRVSIGYQGQTDWQSEGWWTFAPGECGIVLSGALTRQHYYWKAHAEGHDYGGDYAFCTGPSPYTIMGDSDCANRGYTRELFVLEDTGPTATRWTITLAGAPISAPKGPAPKAPDLTDPVPRPAPMPLAALPAPQLEYIDYQAGFAPGTYGDPNYVEARFLGCHEDGGGDWCVFEGDGVEWLVYPSDANYSETFTSLSFLTPGQRVNLWADIVNFNDASVEVAVQRVEAITTASDLDRVWFALQGFFTDPRDSRARAEVIGNTMFELYDNTQVTAYRFSVVPNCDGTAATGPAMILSDPESGWSNCAILTYLGPDGFDYTEMGMLQGPIYRR